MMSNARALHNLPVLVTILVAFMLMITPLPDAAEPRITSYNVCYTKLLRLRTIAAQRLLATLRFRLGKSWIKWSMKMVAIWCRSSTKWLLKKALPCVRL